MRLEDDFPEISTKRFLLRNITEEDTSEIFVGLSHPDVIRYYGISYDSFVATYEQIWFYQRLFLHKRGIWWGISAPFHSNKLIGACGFSAWKPESRTIELGYWLMPEWWGLGIMTESVGAIVDYAFNSMTVSQIDAQIEPENAASIALAKRLGFQENGVLEKHEFKNGQYIDLLVFSKFKEDQ